MEQVHGVNCFTARWNWQGIAATAESRITRDVAGQRLKVRFEIVDRRFGVLAGPVKEGEVDPNRVQRGPYTVYLTLQVPTMTSMSRLYVVRHQMKLVYTASVHAHVFFCSVALSFEIDSATKWPLCCALLAVTRCSALADNTIFHPSPVIFKGLFAWSCCRV